MPAKKALPYTLVQDGRYFYRRRTPQGLEWAFGGKEIKRPFHTSDPGEAAARWNEIHNEVEARIKELRDGTVAADAHPRAVANDEPGWKPPVADALSEFEIVSYLSGAFARYNEARETWRRMHPDAAPTALANAWPPEGIFDWLVRHIEQARFMKLSPSTLSRLRHQFHLMVPGLAHAQASMQAVGFAVHVGNQQTVEARADAAAHQMATAPHLVAPAPVTLGELIDQFTGDANRQDLKASSKGNHNAPFAILKDVLGAERDIRLITRQDIKDVRNIMLWLPRDAKRQKAFKDMPFQEIARVTEEKYEAVRRVLDEMGEENPTIELLDELGMPTPLMRSAVNKYLGSVTQLFAYARSETMITASPAEDIKLRKVPDSAKREFYEDELQQLFHRDYKLDGIGWIPLICLYQGFRPNETCQLDSVDVVPSKRTGIPSFQITVEMRDPAVDARMRSGSNNTDKATKNRYSQRVVPIHHRLLDLGFGNYAASRVAAGEKKLFDVKKYGANGNYYDSVRKDLVALLREAEVYTPETTIHSFRHTFAWTLRQLYPRDTQIREAVGGWSVNGSSEIDYASEAFCAETLKPFLDKVEYPGLFKLARAA